MISILLVYGLFLTDIFIILLTAMINGLSQNIFSRYIFLCLVLSLSNLCLSIMLNKYVTLGKQENILCFTSRYLRIQTIQKHGLIHSLKASHSVIQQMEEGLQT